MKILHVVESFEGGVLTSVCQLCSLQAKQGAEVILAYSQRPKTPPDFKKNLDSRVVTEKISLTRSISLPDDLRGLFEIKKIMVKSKPDVVHLHSSKAGLIGRMAAFFPGRGKYRLFYSPRGFSFLRTDIPPRERSLYFLLEKLASLIPCTIVACSRGEAEAASRLKARKIVTVENAVDTGIVPVRKEWTGHGNSVSVGTLGRLCPQKDPRCFGRLAQKFADVPGVRFIWVGGGEDDYRLGQIENIVVTGWLERIKALEQLSRLDIYIQTSLWEGMPLSLIEAMVSGIPAVVTDIAGNRDIVIQGRTGFIARNEAEMASFLELLLNNPALRRQMGHEARRTALERFSLPRLDREMALVYRGFRL